MIRLYKLPPLLRLLSPKAGKQKSWPTDKIVAFTDTILELEKFIYRRNCFKRTLSLYYFLKRIGLPVQVNLGVRKKQDELEGHGWLTLHGQPYCEPNAQNLNYQVVYFYPQ
ncbi:MAG: lasso peptide biosynthesis B2 protein [Candidatus Schekmanbacteria bacterium]|nr:lasso peptide biosynthesis B2 protein [Candidatus Schekmanbacteria bacterium]